MHTLYHFHLLNCDRKLYNLYLYHSCVVKEFDCCFIVQAKINVLKYYTCMHVGKVTSFPLNISCKQIKTANNNFSIFCPFSQVDFRNPISEFYWLLCYVCDSDTTNNGCNCTIIVIYVDIMTGEKLSSIQLANMELVHWSVRSSNRRGGRQRGWKGGNRYFSPLQVSLYNIKIWCKIQVIIYLSQFQTP